MSWKICTVAAAAALALAGCVDESDFGSSGVSGQAGLSLARDVCIRDITDRGGTVIRVESARQIQNRAEVILQTRRSPASVNTERRLCTFYFNTGLHDTRPI